LDQVSAISCLVGVAHSVDEALETKNMVEGEFVLLGTEVDDSGIP
jgi:hypothetical protein